MESLYLKQSVHLGLIPGELTGTLPPGVGFPMRNGLACVTDPGRQLSHIFTSMFLHGSWMHLLGKPIISALGAYPGPVLTRWISVTVI